MADTYSCLLYHVVFSTKHRRRLITPDLQPRLYSYIGGIIEKGGGKLLRAGGVEDHIHLFISGNTEFTLSSVIRQVKSRSTKWVKANFPQKQEFRWQTGGGLFTVSRSQSDTLHRYIARQPEHHRRMTFEEELRELLRKHGIEFDEKYLLD